MKTRIVKETAYINESGFQRTVTETKEIKFKTADKIVITVSTEYKLSLSDFVVLELPKSCHGCPCGFSSLDGSCGRNVPWTEVDSKQRPSTCKLRTLDQYLEENNIQF